MMMMQVGVLAAWLAVCVSGFDVPAVHYTSLMRDDTSKDVRNALATEGLFQVTEIPGLAEMRKSVFQDAAACVQAGGAMGAFPLQDGALRKSFVMTSHQGNAFDMAIETIFANHNVPEVCHRLKASSFKLRNTVTRVSHLVFSQLDNACGGRRASEPFARSSNAEYGHYESAWQFLNSGEHLEHFHSYEANCNNTLQNTESLPMHTDEGLFIGLIPAMWFDSNVQEASELHSSSGFSIELVNGEIVQPQFKDSGNVLVFMTGQGSEDWFGKCPPMRPTPHSLKLDVSCDGSQQYHRLWYGRMFMPPRDAIHEPTNYTFGELREQRIQQITNDEPTFADTQSVGACSSRLALRDLARACDQGEAWCWMECRPWDIQNSGCTPTTSPTSSEIVCKSPTGTVWVDGDSHCPTCVITCQPPDSAGNVPLGFDPNNPVCNGVTATAMYMAGFTGFDNTESCIVILFREWVLDSTGKYIAGTFGTFFFGILTESVIWLRKKKSKSAKQNPLPHAVEVILHMLLYITQVTFGYFAMLIAMTYSAVLFVAIVLGLATGHFFFNMNLTQMQSKSADPCCQFMDGHGDECDSNYPREVANGSSGSSDIGSDGDDTDTDPVTAVVVDFDEEIQRSSSRDEREGSCCKA